MRASWKGTISFGLVSIPVKIYNAAAPKEVKFSLLHLKDGGKIRYKRYCEKCKEEVGEEDIVRGFEISKGEYVVLTDEDLEKIPLKTAKSIEIKQFFEPSELGIVYYSNFYYVAPDKGGEKPYSLLRDAMKATNAAGIGKMALKGRENLVVVREFDGGVILANIHYIDEIRSPLELPGWNAKADISEEEFELAKKLITVMKKPLKLENYRNEYKEALINLIEAKLSGKEVVVTEKISPAKSLMDALKASLEALAQ